MELDYSFLKEILSTMEQNSEHEMDNFKIMEKLNIQKEREDKFIGHIRILADKGFISCENCKYPFGFSYTNYGVRIDRTAYRITAIGYDFLEILENDTIFNKIKNFTISVAYEAGLQLLTQFAIKPLVSL